MLKYKKNIAYRENCEELINEIINTFGKIDILINNASKCQKLDYL